VGKITGISSEFKLNLVELETCPGSLRELFRQRVKLSKGSYFELVSQPNTSGIAHIQISLKWVATGTPFKWWICKV